MIPRMLQVFGLLGHEAIVSSLLQAAQNAKQEYLLSFNCFPFPTPSPSMNPRRCSLSRRMIWEHLRLAKSKRVAGEVSCLECGADTEEHTMTVGAV